MAIFLSIIAIGLFVVRIEPIDFNDGSVMLFSVGLMDVCTTLMMTPRIMGHTYYQYVISNMYDCSYSYKVN